MVKVMVLVIGIVGLQLLPVIGGDLCGEDPVASGRQGQTADSVGTPGLRIARVIEITDGTTWYWWPVWSPDGKKLAFTGADWRGVYVKNADGSGPVQDLPFGGRVWCFLFWTADSKALICEAFTGSRGVSVGRVDVETGKLDVLAGPFGAVDRYSRNSYGDVTFVVGNEVKVLDTVAGGVRSMNEYYSNERPRSHDVRLEMDRHDSRMWVIEDGGLKRTEFPHKVILPKLSPKADRVAFVQGDGNIYVSRLDGSGMVSVGRGCCEAWSADGERLAYLGAIEENEWNVTAAELFVADADGSSIVQITHTPDQVKNYPAWSPDGMRIAYSTDNTGKIYVAVLEEVD